MTAPPQLLPWSVIAYLLQGTGALSMLAGAFSLALRRPSCHAGVGYAVHGYLLLLGFATAVSGSLLALWSPA